jgi:hypothetical protein
MVSQGLGGLVAIIIACCRPNGAVARRLVELALIPLSQPCHITLS